MKRSVLIDAPIEKVFAYYTDPSKAPEYWPSMVEVRDVTHVNGRPSHFRWTYKMAGMKLEGETKVEEYEVNRRVVMESSGGIRAANVIEFSSVRVADN